MTSNFNMLIVVAILPLALAAYESSLPSTPPGDADIVKALVKEVKELKLVVKDLQSTVKKQGDHIVKLENDQRKPTSIDVRRPSVDELFSGKGTRAVDGNVAFSSYLDHKLSALSAGFTIVCNQALLNEGNAYNVHTGTFTAPAGGVYLFTFSLADWGAADRAGVHLVVDGVNQIDAVVDPFGGHFQMAGNTAILRLTAGQVVWLKSATWDDNDLTSSQTDRLVTFSGIKMY